MASTYPELKNIVRSPDAKKAADNRAAALMIDTALAYLMMFPFAVFIEAVMTPGFFRIIFMIICWGAATILLQAWFESSPLQATPGKLACGLRVISVDGARLSFLRALRRNMLKSAFPALFSGAIYSIALARNPHALTIHDRLARTRVATRAEIAAGFYMSAANDR